MPRITPIPICGTKPATKLEPGTIVVPRFAPSFKSMSETTQALVAAEPDLEKTSQSQQAKAVELKAEPENDFHVVSFEGTDDPMNPLNWPRGRKWILVGLMSAMTLVVNLATLMCAPAAPLIIKDFRSTGRIYETLLVSIWELGEAFGPLMIAPLSELYGREPLYHTANILFCVFSIACALSKNLNMMIAFRFLNGITVASVVLNPPIIGDLFIVEQRGNAMSLMGLAPLLGPVLGPIAGGYISQSIGWRWCFWLAAILAGVLEIGFLAYFRETYKVKILERKASKLRLETGDHTFRTLQHTTTTGRELLLLSIIRPVRMMCLSPIIFLLSLYVAIVFAYTYVVFTTISEVFESKYGFSTGSASLTFLGLGIGFTAGMFLCRAALDRYVRRMKSRGGMKPEHRLPPMIFAGLVIPIGLFWYGWAAQTKTHWIMPIIGTAFIGVGVVATMISSFSYLVDAFGIYSASAVAANISLRCVTGAFLPLIAPPLYSQLGLGWGNSVLGFIALLFIPVPLALMRYGEAIRSRSGLSITS